MLFDVTLRCFQILRQGDWMRFRLLKCINSTHIKLKTSCAFLWHCSAWKLLVIAGEGMLCASRYIFFGRYGKMWMLFGILYDPNTCSLFWSSLTDSLCMKRCVIKISNIHFNWIDGLKCLFLDIDFPWYRMPYPFLVFSVWLDNFSFSPSIFSTHGCNANLGCKFWLLFSKCFTTSWSSFNYYVSF